MAGRPLRFSSRVLSSGEPAGTTPRPPHLVVRNVALSVTISRGVTTVEAEVKAARTPWTAGEVKTFLSGIRGERLFAVIPPSLMGLRPAEVCGPRWGDVDFETATIAAGKNARPLAGGGVPDVILAAWAGHADGGTLAKRV